MTHDAVSLDRYYAAQIEQLPLYKKWGALMKAEQKTFFPERDRVDATCTGCSSPRTTEAFRKLGFTYRRCVTCGSIFVSPRPTAEALQRFYGRARAMKFWRDRVLSPARPKKQQPIISPLSLWIGSMVHRYFGNKTISVIDYRPLVTSLWDTPELAERKIHLSLIEPVLLKKQHRPCRVIDALASVKKSSADIVTICGVLEQEYSPKDTIAALARTLSKGGLFLLTTNTMSGFEYQVLDQYSPRILPPYRLNLLTIEAIEGMLSRAGFTLLDVATPGKLDIDIVAATLEQNQSIPQSPFIRQLLLRHDVKTARSFQDFLQLNAMSSHLRIAARKR